jgi:hypothetical protein
MTYSFKGKSLVCSQDNFLCDARGADILDWATRKRVKYYLTIGAGQVAFDAVRSGANVAVF